MFCLSIRCIDRMGGSDHDAQCVPRRSQGELNTRLERDQLGV